MMDIMLGLREAGINQVPGAVCVAVTEEGVLVEKGGVQELVPGQHVVVAVGSQSADHAWIQAYCDEHDVECLVIGDAKMTRRALQAIQEGVDAALAI